MADVYVDPAKQSIVRSFVDRVWSLIKIGYCRATNTDPETFATGSTNAANINIAKEPISRADTLTSREDFHASVGTIRTAQLFAVDDQAVHWKQSLDSCSDVAESTMDVIYESPSVHSTEKNTIVTVNDVGDESAAPVEIPTGDSTSAHIQAIPASDSESPVTSPVTETRKHHKISSGHFFDQSINEEEDFDFNPLNESELNDIQSKHPSLPVTEKEQTQWQLSEAEEGIIDGSANAIPVVNNDESTSTPASDREVQDDFTRSHEPQICHSGTNEVVTLNIPNSEPIEESEQAYSFQPANSTSTTVSDREARDDFIRAHQPPICHFDTNEVVTLNIPNSESFEEAEQAYNSQPADSTSTPASDREVQDDFTRSHEPQICHSGTNEVVTLNIPNSEPIEESEQAYSFQPVNSTSTTVDDREAQDDFIRAHQPQICHFDTSEVVTLNIPSSESFEEAERAYSSQPSDTGAATSMMELHNSFNGEKVPAEPISTPAESYIWRSQGEESDQYDNLHHSEAEGKNEPLQTAAATLISEPDSEQDEKSALSKNESVASDDYLEQFETYRRLKFSGSYEEETANFPHQQTMPAASLDEDYKEISPVPQQEIDTGMSPVSETELEIVGERNTDSDLDLMKDDIVPPETHFFQSDHSNSELNVVPSDPLNCKVDLSQSGAVELSMDAVAEEEQFNCAQEIIHEEQETNPSALSHDDAVNDSDVESAIYDSERSTKSRDWDTFNSDNSSRRVSNTLTETTANYSKNSSFDEEIRRDTNSDQVSSAISTTASSNTNEYCLGSDETLPLDITEGERADRETERYEVDSNSFQANDNFHIQEETEERDGPEDYTFPSLVREHSKELIGRQIESEDTSTHYLTQQKSFDRAMTETFTNESSTVDYQSENQQKISSEDEMSEDYHGTQDAHETTLPPDSYPEIQEERSAEDFEKESAGIERFQTMTTEEYDINSPDIAWNSSSLARSDDLEQLALEASPLQVPYPEVRITAEEELTSNAYMEPEVRTHDMEYFNQNKDFEEDHKSSYGQQLEQVQYSDVQHPGQQESAEGTEEHDRDAIVSSYVMQEPGYDRQNYSHEEGESEKETEPSTNLEQNPEIVYNLLEDHQLHQVSYANVQSSTAAREVEESGEQEMNEVTHADFPRTQESDDEQNNYHLTQKEVEEDGDEGEEVKLTESLGRMPEMQHNVLLEAQHWNHVPYPEVQLEDNKMPYKNTDDQDLTSISDAELVDKDFSVDRSEFSKTEGNIEEESAKFSASPERSSEIEQEQLREHNWSKMPYPKMHSTTSEASGEQEAADNMSHASFVEQNDARHNYNIEDEKEDEANDFARGPEMHYNESLDQRRDSNDLSVADTAASSRSAHAYTDENSNQSDAVLTEERNDTDQQFVTDKAAEVDELGQTDVNKTEEEVDGEKCDMVESPLESEPNVSPLEELLDMTAQENRDDHLYEQAESIKIQSQENDLEQYEPNEQLPIDSYSLNSSSPVSQIAENLQHELNASTINEPLVEAFCAEDETPQDVQQNRMLDHQPDFYTNEFNSPASLLAHPNEDHQISEKESEAELQELPESEESLANFKQRRSSPSAEQLTDYASALNEDGDKQKYISTSRIIQYSVSDPDIRQATDCNPQPYYSDEEHGPEIEAQEELNYESARRTEPMPALLDLSELAVSTEAYALIAPESSTINSVHLLRTESEDDQGEPLRTEHSSNYENFMQITGLEGEPEGYTYTNNDEIQSDKSELHKENHSSLQNDSIQTNYTMNTENEFVLDDQLTEDVPDYAQINTVDKGKIWQRNSASYYSIAHPSDSEDDAEEVHHTISQPLQTNRDVLAAVVSKEEQAVQQIVSDVLRSVEAEFSVLP